MDSFSFRSSSEGLEDPLVCNINEVRRLEILSIWLKNTNYQILQLQKKIPGLIHKGGNQIKGTEKEPCRCMLFKKNLNHLIE